MIISYFRGKPPTPNVLPVRKISGNYSELFQMFQLKIKEIKIRTFFTQRKMKLNMLRYVKIRRSENKIC